MDSTRTNHRSRAEINHTPYNNSPSPSPYNPNANKHLLLNAAYSEPIPQSRILLTNAEDTENIPPQSSFQFTTITNTTTNHIQSQSKHNSDPLKNQLDSIMSNHRQYDHDDNDRMFKSQENEEVTMNENQLHEDDADNDSELDSEPEPSPTPIVSDLDDLLADTPNIYSNISITNSSSSPSKDTLKISTNIPSISSFPTHGISIPYNLDDEDSDTPEPLDTPQTPGSNCNFDNVPYHNLHVNVNINDDDTKLEEEDIILSDLDDVNIDDIPPPSYRPILGLSRSWQEKTMTNRSYKSSQRIKCITPITQEMAEMKIKKFVNRRRSVANITPSVHKLFKLDPDLMRIREEYLQRSRSQNNDDTEDESDDEQQPQQPSSNNTRSKPMVDDQIHEQIIMNVDQTNDCDELNTNNDNSSPKTLPFGK